MKVRVFKPLVKSPGMDDGPSGADEPDLLGQFEAARIALRRHFEGALDAGRGMLDVGASQASPPFSWVAGLETA